MGRLGKAYWLGIAGLGLALVCGGEERWVVRFHSFENPAGIPDEPCTYISWVDRLVFRNTGPAPATVRFLGVSNGQTFAGARDLVIPTGREVVDETVNTTWVPVRPGVGGPIWINHLDVPPAVVMSSRAEAWAGHGSPCAIGRDNRISGTVAFPVFDHLVSPNTSQYHLAVDLGSSHSSQSANAHINVGIYNAGTATATATIEIRRACDERVIESRTVTVPPNSLIQFGGFATSTSGSCTDGAIYRDYAVVTVDQPSLSYVATASNELPARIPVSVSMTR